MMVTVWRRLNEKTKIFEHNHIEDGHSLLDKPVANGDYQKKSWSGTTWKRIYAHINSNHIIIYSYV